MILFALDLVIPLDNLNSHKRKRQILEPIQSACFALLTWVAAIQSVAVLLVLVEPAVPLSETGVKERVGEMRVGCTYTLA